jgi:tetratricopeptide (TPR) repeat protein
MKRFVRRLKTFGTNSLSTSSDSESDDNDDREWFETDSFHEEFKAGKAHSKAVAKCRQQLLAQVKSGAEQPIHALLRDAGATGSRNVAELALQSLALTEAALHLHLGQFLPAHRFLEALQADEHLPATYFFRSQIFNIQGYRNEAAEQLQSALDVMPSSPPSQNSNNHARFRDLLVARLACTQLDDCKSDQSPDQRLQACVTLFQQIFTKWLGSTLPEDYDHVAVCVSFSNHRS